MEIEKLETFINLNGYPILRRCKNCVFWNSQEDNPLSLGYCKASTLFFAFTLTPSVYPMTKDFYLCDKHKFKDEEKLKIVSKTVLLKDAIKKKDEI